MPAKSRVFRRPFLFIAALGMMFASTQAHAAALKNSEFLKMSAGQRHYYYAGAYDVLGHWTSLNQPDKAECVWGWLAEKPKERKALLDESFEAYPDYAPTAIIFALVQRDCGSILPTPQAEPATTQN